MVNIKLIERNDYLKQLENVKGTPDIKVITGIRRSGKSKLLESFINKIVENDITANIIHINFNNCKYEHLFEYHSLLEYVEEKYKNASMEKKREVFKEVHDLLKQPVYLHNHSNLFATYNYYGNYFLILKNAV